MSDTTEESDDLDWRGIMDSLTNGQKVDIPVGTEKEFARRSRQLAKRAERYGLAVDVQRAEGALRVEPRGAAAAPVDATQSDDHESRDERRQERAQRRTERAASRGG
jgi:hypothetical protein